MFVQDFMVIDARYEDVEARLVMSHEVLFGEALGSTRSAHENMTARVGPKNLPTALGKAVDIRPGPVRRHDDRTLIAFSWEPHGAASLFPHLDADLEVAPLGPDRTMITVRGTYDTPGGQPAKAVDELLSHRIAESTMRAFLEALCASFAQFTSPR